MAGMGKTGTVNITPEMMDEAIKAIRHTVPPLLVLLTVMVLMVSMVL